jgi:hypothetical protein
MFPAVDRRHVLFALAVGHFTTRMLVRLVVDGVNIDGRARYPNDRTRFVGVREMVTSLALGHLACHIGGDGARVAVFMPFEYLIILVCGVLAPKRIFVTNYAIN